MAVSGTKTYILNYYAAGRERRATLARCSEIPVCVRLAKRAGRELVAIRAGETDLLERRRESREAPTVNDLLDRFFDEYVPERIAASRMTKTTARKYREPGGQLPTALPLESDRSPTLHGFMSKRWRSRLRARRRYGIECLRSRAGCSPSPNIGSGDRNGRIPAVASTERRNRRGTECSNPPSWRL